MGSKRLTRSPHHRPDLIMLDWNMPNMDGITFLKKYRADGGPAKVIMVTTEAEKCKVIEALQAGRQ